MGNKSSKNTPPEDDTGKEDSQSDGELPPKPHKKRDGPPKSKETIPQAPSTKPVEGGSIDVDIVFPLHIYRHTEHKKTFTLMENHKQTMGAFINVASNLVVYRGTYKGHTSEENWCSIINVPHLQAMSLHVEAYKGHGKEGDIKRVNNGDPTTLCAAWDSRAAGALPAKYEEQATLKPRTGGRGSHIELKECNEIQGILKRNPLWYIPGQVNFVGHAKGRVEMMRMFIVMVVMYLMAASDKLPG